MNKFNNKESIKWYFLTTVGIVFFAFLIMIKAANTMTVKKDYWMQVAALQKKDSVLKISDRPPYIVNVPE